MKTLNDFFVLRIGDETPAGKVVARRVQEELGDDTPCGDDITRRVMLLMRTDDGNSAWVDQHHVTRTMWGRANRKINEEEKKK